MPGLRRRLAATLLGLVLAGCSGAPATPAPLSSTSIGATSVPGTTALAESFAPLETQAPIDTGPLPAPSFASAEDIVGAMSDPDQAPQVVVSMLQLMGIGLYEANGTPIRAGTARSDLDFYVFEPEARGLIAMLRLRNEPDDQLSFRDFHAALVHLGFTGSAGQLAMAYQDAYAADPTAFVSEMVAALGGVDVDGSISGFEEWLLLLDGFVRPNAAATAMANAGAWPGRIAFGGGGWAVAQQNMQPYISTQMRATRIEVATRLLAVARAARIEVTTNMQSVHEGHGATGDAMQALAHVVLGAQQFVSPFTGQAILSSNPNAEGLKLGWEPDAAAIRHGTLNRTTSDTDMTGEAYVIYTANQEAANGVGTEMRETAQINAFFYDSDLILTLYGSGVGQYLPLIPGTTEHHAVFYVGWHENVQAAVKILWTDTYNGVEDTITFLGTLDHVDTINGLLTYWGKGTASGSRVGWKGCNPGFDGPINGLSFAEFDAYPTRAGYIEISAFVEAGQPLTGIVTEPIEVELEDGVTLIPVIEAPPPGENGGGSCPHGSYGQVELSGLTLPPP